MKPKQITNSKPRVDNTRKARADRRKAFLDAAAKRTSMVDWGSIEKWTRECMEEAVTDQDVNNRLRIMFTALCNSIPDGNPNIAPADVAQVLELYPPKGRAVKVTHDTKLSDQTSKRVQRGIEKYGDEAGRLAVRPKLEPEQYKHVFQDDIDAVTAAIENIGFSPLIKGD